MRKGTLFLFVISALSLHLYAFVEEPGNYSKRNNSESILITQISSSDFEINMGKFEIFNASNAPELKLNWGYSMKPALNLSSDNKAISEDNESLYVYSYDKEFANISMFNISVNYKLVKDVFVSLDYFHYNQNQPFNSFYCDNSLSNKFSLCREADLGEIIDLKVIFRQSQTLEARLLALWAEIGKTYSNNTEDTKTFEIRGEIIVNF